MREVCRNCEYWGYRYATEFEPGRKESFCEYTPPPIVMASILRSHGDAHSSESWRNQSVEFPLTYSEYSCSEFKAR